MAITGGVRMSFSNREKNLLRLMNEKIELSQRHRGLIRDQIYGRVLTDEEHKELRELAKKNGYFPVKEGAGYIHIEGFVLETKMGGTYTITGGNK